MLKAGVAEALARLRKPAAPVELKGPPLAAELPFAVPATRRFNPVPATPQVQSVVEPGKTAPPIAPEPKPAAEAKPSVEPKPAEPKPVAEFKTPSPKRVSESTLQVDNVEDLLVSLPSLAAIPISSRRARRRRPFPRRAADAVFCADFRGD